MCAYLLTYGDLVDRLWVLAEVIPEHGGIVSPVEVSGGVTLLSVDEVRELGCSIRKIRSAEVAKLLTSITKEEDRGAGC